MNKAIAKKTLMFCIATVEGYGVEGSIDNRQRHTHGMQTSFRRLRHPTSMQAAMAWRDISALLDWGCAPCDVGE